MAGKGSKYRPVDQKKYSENYDLIFSKKEVVTSEDAKESLLDELDRTSFSEIQKCCGGCKCSEF
jgi:ferredoxin